MLEEKEKRGGKDQALIIRRSWMGWLYRDWSLAWLWKSYGSYTLYLSDFGGKGRCKSRTLFDW